MLAQSQESATRARAPRSNAVSAINQPQRSWTAIDDGCTAEAYQQGTCSIVL